jgi:hypothetical protein
MKIGFDVDGVLYDWHEVIYDYAVRFENYRDTYEKYWYDFGHGNRSKIYVDYIVKNPTFVTKVAIDPKIKQMLWDLSKEHEIFYVTARPKEIVRATHRWFKDSDVPYMENVFIATNDDKVPFIIEHGIELFIDDRDKYITALEPYTRVIVVRKPWNKFLWDTYTNVGSVLEIPNIIRSEHVRV